MTYMIEPLVVVCIWPILMIGSSMKELKLYISIFASKPKLQLKVFQKEFLYYKLVHFLDYSKIMADSYCLTSLLLDWCILLFIRFHYHFKYFSIFSIALSRNPDIREYLVYKTSLKVGSFCRWLHILTSYLAFYLGLATLYTITFIVNVNTPVFSLGFIRYN